MASKGKNIIKTHNLVKIYNKRRVVDKISIALTQGEIVGLLGPNGAGKTTTFHIIIGLIRPNSGEIYFNDCNITKLPMYKRARKGIGYLSQEPSVFHKLTVEQNIMAILETLPAIRSSGRVRKLPKKERNRLLEQYLNELSIAHLAKNKAYTLSGGERRKLEITRSLITNPSFLFLDEPFAGIDPLAVSDIQDIIKKLQKKNIGVLITDHNVRDTLQITDRAYIIYDGKLLLSGTSQELVNDPKAREVYLGEKFTKDFS